MDDYEPITFKQTRLGWQPAPDDGADHDPDDHGGTPHDDAKGKPQKPKRATAKKEATNVKHPTREAWLIAGMDAMRPWLADAGTAIKDKVRVSCGWPLGTRKAIGQAFHTTASADGSRAIFISPRLASADGKTGVLSTLLHEMVHCALPPNVKHGREFAMLSGTLGLVKPWTATSASPALCEKLTKLAARLGPYPHSAMNGDKDRKKQTTRLVKCECKVCGYIVRTTAKWLEVGAPRCTVQAHGEMKVKD